VLALMIVATLTIRPQGLVSRWEIEELLQRWQLRQKPQASARTEENHA
jgi:hypothetical protein